MQEDQTHKVSLGALMPNVRFSGNERTKSLEDREGIAQI